jgi:Zn-dependent protease with chaperone function
LTVKTEACPNCKADLPVHNGFRTWCDACNWNAGVDELCLDDPADSFLWKINKRLSREKGRALFQNVLTSRSKELGEKRSGNTGRWVFIVGLYFMLLGGTVAAGVFLLVFFWKNPILVVVGLAFLALAWVIRPRHFPSPKHHLESSQFPLLFEFAAEVSDTVGSRRPKYICIDDEFNASVYQTGKHRDTVLTIGLPLWTILSPQEKVALLAHEFAHIVAGDPARGRWVSASNHALANWLSVLDTSTGDIRALFGRVLFLPLTMTLRGLGAALARACFQESQIAEYRADCIAIKVAGRANMISMLKALRFASALRPFLQTLAGGRDSRGETAISSFRKHVKTMPDREKLRLERGLLNGDASVDSTHPPTQFRVEYMQSLNISQAAVFLDPVRAQMIDHELETLEAELSDQLYEKEFGSA